MALPVIATAVLVTGGVLALSKYRMEQLPPNTPQSGNAGTGGGPGGAVSGAVGSDTQTAPAAPAGGDQAYDIVATVSQTAPGVQSWIQHPEGGAELMVSGVDPSISPNAQPTAAAVGTAPSVVSPDAVAPASAGVTAVQLKYGLSAAQTSGVPAYAQARAIADFGAANGDVW